MFPRSAWIKRQTVVVCSRTRRTSAKQDSDSKHEMRMLYSKGAVVREFKQIQQMTVQIHTQIILSHAPQINLTLKLN